MAARQGPNIFGLKRGQTETGARGGRGQEGEGSKGKRGGRVGHGDREKLGQRGLLQITAILHKPSRKWHWLSLP